jgi:hypothetical protein
MLRSGYPNGLDCHDDVHSTDALHEGDLAAVTPCCRGGYYEELADRICH